MRRRFPLQLPAVLIFGIISQIGQVLLLRELLMVFHGNELAIGLILAAWLTWGAVGSRVGTCIIERCRSINRWLLLNTAFVAFLIPATVIMSRLSRGFFDLLPGTYLSLPQIVLASLLIPLPLCLALGAQFVILARIWREQEPFRDTAGAGKTYTWEAIGNLLGGILFTFIIVRFFNSLQTAVAAGGLLLGAGLFFVLSREIPSPPPRRRFLMLITACLLPAMLAAHPGWLRLETWSYRRQWHHFAPEYRLLDVRQSKYGNITVAARTGQYSFFQSGHLVFSTAGPENVSASRLEEQEAAMFAHLALAQHRNPQHVLLLGGGLRGTLSEMLKHPVARIDYIELDRQLTAASRPWLPAATRRALADPRVQMIHTDGRMFVKGTDRRYDLIIADIPDPATAVLNRYYTLEFFAEAERILNSDGILMVGAGSAPDLRGLALVNRKAAIYHTLKRVFTRVLPLGERFVYFFAGNDPEQLSADPAVLAERYTERRVDSESFSSRHYRMLVRDEQTRRLGWILRNHGRQPDSHLAIPSSPPLRPASIEEQEAAERHLPPVRENYFINSDFRPIGYYYTLMYWEDAAAERRGRFFHRLLQVRGRWLIMPFPVLLAGAFALRRLEKQQAGKRKVTFAVMTAVFTTGLSTMTLQIALIFSFQSVYGYIYEMIGLIVAVFMGGLGLGAALTQHHFAARANLRTLAVVQVLMTVLAGLIGILLPGAAAIRQPWLIFIIFTTLTMIAGFLNGVDFPLAVACFRNACGSIDRSAGSVYSMELAGACIGATLASVLLAPIFGIAACCWFAALGNGTAFLAIMITGTGK